jgi:hypothetical protein
MLGHWRQHVPSIEVRCCRRVNSSAKDMLLTPLSILWQSSIIVILQIVQVKLRVDLRGLDLLWLLAIKAFEGVLSFFCLVILGF